MTNTNVSSVSMVAIVDELIRRGGEEELFDHMGVSTVEEVRYLAAVQDELRSLPDDAYDRATELVRILQPMWDRGRVGVPDNVVGL